MGLQKEQKNPTCYHWDKFKGVSALPEYLCNNSLRHSSCGMYMEKPMEMNEVSKRSGLFVPYSRETKWQNFQVGGVEMHPQNSNFFFFVVLGNVCVYQSISLFL